MENSHFNWAFSISHHYWEENLFTDENESIIKQLFVWNRKTDVPKKCNYFHVSENKNKKSKHIRLYAQAKTVVMKEVPKTCKKRLKLKIPSENSLSAYSIVDESGSIHRQKCICFNSFHYAPMSSGHTHVRCHTWKLVWASFSLCCVMYTFSVVVGFAMAVVVEHCLRNKTKQT